VTETPAIVVEVVGAVVSAGKESSVPVVADAVEGVAADVDAVVGGFFDPPPHAATRLTADATAADLSTPCHVIVPPALADAVRSPPQHCDRTWRPRSCSAKQAMV
jgi:hypothetical protein